jgi:hypothetical protein
MSQVLRTRVLELKGSEKNANYGKSGGFNNLRRVQLDEMDDGTVVMSLFSQKRDAPGQILKFSETDFRLFENFVFPLLQEFDGVHGVEAGVKTKSLSYGVDASGNPVFVLPRQDKSIRVKLDAVLSWAGSKVRPPKSPAVSS